MAIADVVDLLACPRCRRPLALTADARSAHCPGGHAYDLARQGYLNLLPGRRPKNADTVAMVDARGRFLAGGHYAPIADRLAQLAAAHAPPAARVLEVGAGTGYYLTQVLAALSGGRGVALDVSVPAARRAAGARPRAGSVVADVWQRVPLLDGCVDVLLDVFAPRNGDEFARLLSTTGVLVVVVPEPARTGAAALRRRAGRRCAARPGGHGSQRLPPECRRDRRPGPLGARAGNGLGVRRAQRLGPGLAVRRSGLRPEDRSRRQRAAGVGANWVW
jgi:23S rRNA (guanine745-N1)-methyltransferase